MKINEMNIKLKHHLIHVFHLFFYQKNMQRTLENPSKNGH